MSPSVDPMHQRRTGKSNNARNGHSNNMYGNRGYGDVEGGSGRHRGGGMSARETNANIMEQQNNERISELSDQVARLKGLTVEIGNEVREQNSLLDGMGEGFQSTQDLLAGSLRRIGSMLESGGAKHMLYMVGFVVFIMVVLYWLMKFK